MNFAHPLTRIILATTLLASLGACTVIPSHPVAYHRPAPIYVETYPTYSEPRPIYIAPVPRYIHREPERHDGYHHRQYRDERPNFDRSRERRGERRGKRDDD